MTPGPLNGVRVLDFTHVWAGPLATRILGDLGADVLKVEAPWARGPASPAPVSPTMGAGVEHWNQQGVTNKLNRNKRGICLDSKTADGHRLLLELVRSADVVIENFSARAMASMGLDYAALQAANPTIIYVAMPGFGVSGPYRDFVAFGPVVEPMSGLTSFMGYGDDEPRVTAMGLPDACAGVTAATAVVTALHRRDETGEGGFIELALHEAPMALFGEYFLQHQLDGALAPTGNAHPHIAPHGIYRCAGEDEWIAIVTRNDAEWLALAGFAGLGWAIDPQFQDLQARLHHRACLDEAIEAWTERHDKLTLMTQLQAIGVPAGALMVVPEILQDPQITTRDFFRTLPVEGLEAKPFPGFPVVINGQRGIDWRPAPKLGEHNREILRDVLGMDDGAIATLEARGVITTRPP